MCNSPLQKKKKSPLVLYLNIMIVCKNIKTSNNVQQQRIKDKQEKKRKNSHENHKSRRTVISSPDWLKANIATSEKSRELDALIWSKWKRHIKDTAAIFSSRTWVCDLNAFNGLLQIKHWSTSPGFQADGLPLSADCSDWESSDFRRTSLIFSSEGQWLELQINTGLLLPSIHLCG